MASPGFLLLPSIPIPDIDKKALLHGDYQDLLMDLSAQSALVQLRESRIEGDLNLNEISIYGREELAVCGTGMEINGHFYLGKARINGIFYLAEAYVKQSFRADQIRVTGAESRKSVYSLVMPQLKVDGKMTLKDGGMIGTILLSAARVQEELILDEVKVTQGGVLAHNLHVVGDLHIRKAEIESEIELVKSNISGQLNAESVKCSFFDAVNLIVQDKLVLRRSEINMNERRPWASVALSEAYVGGDIDAEELKTTRTSFEAPALKVQGKLSLKESQIDSLNLTKAQINGDLDAIKVRLYGDLKASGLKVEGAVLLGEGKVIGHTYLNEAQIGTKLDAKSMRIEGNLMAQALKVQGALILGGAQVKGGIMLAKGHIGGDLEAKKVRVEESFQVEALTIHGAFLLNDAQVKHNLLLIGGQIGGKIEAEKLKVGQIFGLAHGLIVYSGILLNNGEVNDDIILSDVQIDDELTIKQMKIGKELIIEDLKIQRPLLIEELNVGRGLSLYRVHGEDKVSVKKLFLKAGYFKLADSAIIGSININDISGGGIIVLIRLDVRKGIEISNLIAPCLILGETSTQDSIEISKTNLVEYDVCLDEELKYYSLVMERVSAKKMEMKGVKVMKHCNISELKVWENWEIEAARWSAGASLMDIQVGGNLKLKQSLIGSTSEKAALALSEARINGRLLIENSLIVGELHMEKAHTGRCEVKNSFLTGRGASWRAQEAQAGLFALEKSDIMGSFAAEGLRADTLKVYQCTFTPPPEIERTSVESESSFLLRGAEIKEALEIQGARWSGEVDLSFARIKKIEIYPLVCGAGPEETTRISQKTPIYSEPLESRLRVEGLNFERFLLHEPAHQDDADEGQGHTPLLALNWIRRHLPRFTSTAYFHLAAAFNAEGFEKEATHTLIQKEEDKKAVSGYSLLSQVWHSLLYYTIGHGYRSEWALFWILGFILLGAFLFELGYEAKLIVPASPDIIVQQSYQAHHAIPADYPAFHALGYSIDAFIPFLDLMIEPYWLPDADNFWGHLLRIYLWIHIGLGWILSTLFVSGITGIIRKLE